MYMFVFGGINEFVFFISANQLISIQDMVGITINDLPPETQEQISILSKTSNMLECSDTCSIRYYIYMYLCPCCA